MTLSTSLRRLVVLPAATSAPPPAAAATDAPTLKPARRAVEELGRDILPIHTALRDLRPGLNLGQPGWAILALLLAPPLIYLGLVIVLHLRRQGVEQADAVRARKAARKCRAALRRGNPGPAETLEILRHYINERLGLALGTLTPPEVRQILQAHGASPANSEAFSLSIEHLQQALYSGLAVPPAGDPPVGDPPVGDHPVGDYPVRDYPVANHPNQGTARPSEPVAPAQRPAETILSRTIQSGTVQSGTVRSGALPPESTPTYLVELVRKIDHEVRS